MHGEVQALAYSINQGLHKFQAQGRQGQLEGTATLLCGGLSPPASPVLASSLILTGSTVAAWQHLWLLP